MHHKAFGTLVALAIAAAVPPPSAGAQATRQDSLDFKCIADSVNVLLPITGPANGRKRTLGAAIQACNAAWFKRANETPPPPPPPPPPNSAPVAAFTRSCASATLTCSINATGSTDDKAVERYAVDWGDNTTPATTAIATHKYAKGGSYTIAVQVYDAEGLSGRRTQAITLTAAPVDTFVPPPVDTFPPPPPPPPPPPVDSTLQARLAELPRSVPDSTPKSCTTHKTVAVPDDFQAALNAAQPGDCLDLTAGQEWKGNFVLPRRSCTATTGWITIQTKGIADAPGTRMTPTAAKGFARITTPNNQYAIGAPASTCRWQLVHLNIQVDPAFAGLNYNLMLVGDGGWGGGGEINLSLATQPTDFIIRRSWIHGQPTTNLVRCVAVNGIRLAVADNWIDDCHAKGFDSQAVEGWNGAGPILVTNNFLAGAGENVMFGGADPAIPALVPADLTITGNHVYKDPLWKGVWSIKNLFELKDARRIRIAGNVFENVWADAQVGMAIVFKSSIGGDPTKTFQGTQDVTFEYNVVRRAHRGFNIQGMDCSGQACTDTIVSRVMAQHNLFTEIGTTNGVTPSDGWLMLFGNGMRDVIVRNNTMVSNTPGYGLSLYMAYDIGKWNNVRFSRNIFAGMSYYAIAADCPQNVGTAALNCIIGSTWTWRDNVVTQVDPEFQGAHPSGNTYLARFTDLGLTSTFTAPKYPNAGADIAELTRRTSKAIVASGIAARPKASRPRPYKPTAADLRWMAHQPVSRSTPLDHPR
jgi:PKD repeat protein